jgi:hypothetical protein
MLVHSSNNRGRAPPLDHAIGVERVVVGQVSERPDACGFRVPEFRVQGWGFKL